LENSAVTVREDLHEKKNLREPFNETLKGIYFVDKKMLTTLHKMAKPRRPMNSQRPSKGMSGRRRNTFHG
jgi:hypothetical protein